MAGRSEDGRIKPRHIRPISAAVILLFALAGCQPEKHPVVSLDEARRTAAVFQSQGFRAPPRTVNDIAAIIEARRPDTARLEEAAALADSTPADRVRGDVGELTAYYTRRAAAAEFLGRAAQRADDLRLAYEAGVNAGVDVIVGARQIQVWTVAELNRGHTAKALELSRRRIGTAPNASWELQARANLLTALIQFGDLASAQAELPKIDANLASVRSNLFLPGWVGLSSEFVAERAHALHALGTGKYADAERHLRGALIANAALIRDEASIVRNNNLPPNALTGAGLYARQELSRALARQGKLVEAESEARLTVVERLEKWGREAPETAWAIAGLADVLREQGRFADSERLARLAYDALDKQGIAPDSAMFVRVALLLAGAQSAQREYGRAAATYAELRRRLASNTALTEVVFERGLGWGVVALQSGDPAEARRVFELVAAHGASFFGADHVETLLARGLSAVARRRAGDLLGGRDELVKVAPQLLEGVRRAGTADESASDRDALVRLVIEATMSAWAESGVPNAAAESFRIADAVRGRSVQRALAQSSARAAASDAALAALVREDQDMQKQLGGLRAALSDMLAAPNPDAAAARELRDRIETLRVARDATGRAIEARYPEYAELVDPRPATVERARAVMGDEEALIATYIGEEATFVWALRKTGPVAFAAVPKGRAAIAANVARLRTALDPNAAVLGDIPAFDLDTAYELYRDLLRPVEAGFAGAASLLVVPHDALGQLPFGVLVTAPTRLAPEGESSALFAAYRDVPFLIRKADVTQLPSIASLAALRGLPAASAARKPFVGFGDPWFSAAQMAEARGRENAQIAAVSTQDLQTRGIRLVRRNAPATGGVDSAELSILPRLPDTAEELRGVARALGADASDIVLGAAANERNVASMGIGDRKVVMFATHGLVPGDLNGLTQPALALSAPDVAGIDGDGVLTLDEILGLKLDADWVVLSACNTATGDGAGAEAVSGLGRAFFYAGTRALLVTNWPVETTSARALTTDIFARQAREPGMARASALRQAMLAMIDGPGFVDAQNGRTVFAYSHPIFWAPFALVGDGGGGAPDAARVR